MTEQTSRAMEHVAKTVKQVDKTSGIMRHHNIDDKTFEMLQDTANLHNAFGTPVSQSVVVRRAIRVYYELVKRLKTDEQKIHEGYSLFQAAKGV